ncbi:MAG: 50S ribosomal protein L11 methyltransferase [candidate division KSB1 bacterium]|nr:50S ribosomal protein L11 methyltransferase [candidate division KSB1 bacterium]MDZ7369512.1 50S ribosomal protein L11 methyltransferase [candidate division KSB1 bacterium]MDZ7407605.1 50S ribosomal protein L11 methyltransferase [candidate division KSB1 bacterium]
MKTNPQAWRILSLRPGLALEEILTAHLFDLGAVGTHLFEDRLLVYFPEPCEIESIVNSLQAFLAQLRAGGMRLPAISITHEQIAAQDWHSAWKRYFKPFLVSKRILVRPSWEAAALAPGQIEIVIDPKQAFGTGHHATTRSMLRLLEKYLRPGMRVIDAGAGTGILAIAAAKLQAGVQVVAFDIDPLAAEAAQENIHLNHTQHCIKLYAGPLAALRPLPADLILANLQHQTLLDLLPDFAKLLKHDGALLLSGILENEGASIKTAAQHVGWKCLEILQEEEWLTLAFAQTARLVA